MHTVVEYGGNNIFHYSVSATYSKRLVGGEEKAKVLAVTNSYISQTSKL